MVPPWVPLAERGKFVKLELQFNDSLPTDRELAGVLLRNHDADVLSIGVNGRGDSDWEELLNGIRAHKKLKIVSISDIGSQPTSVTGMNRFLLAMSENQSIEEVQLFAMRSSGAGIASIVERGRNVKILKLEDVSLEQPDRDIIQLSEALKRNRTITCLGLENFSQILVAKCLSALVDASWNLEELHLLPKGQRWSFESSTCLNRFLLSTPTLRRLRFGSDVFHGPTLFDGQSFQPVVEGLFHSGNVVELELFHCTFADETSVDALKRVLTSESNIRKVNISDATLGQEMKLSIKVIQPSLRSVSIVNTFVQDANLFLENDALADLLSAIQKSDVEHFCFGCIKTEEHGRLLVQSIPQMAKLRHLKVVFPRYVRDWRNDQHFRFQFIEAVKKNGSLRKVETPWNSPWLLDVDVQRTLDYCATRNQGIDAWIDTPPKILQSAWPNAFHKALETGPDKAFQALVAISSEVKSSFAKRKRKRPDFYAPQSVRKRVK